MEPVPISAEAGACGRGLACRCCCSPSRCCGRKAVILGRRGYSIVGGRQGDPRRVALGKWKWVALAATFLVLLNPVFLPYGALLNAAFSRVPSEFVSFENLTLHNIAFVFFELSSTGVAFRNTLILCNRRRPPSAP